MPAAKTSPLPVSSPPASKPDRILSLDVLRGFDMFWIVGGKGVVDALAAATGWPFCVALSAQMHHVRWEGFHFYDLIFPLFLFIVGAVIPYALVSRIERGEPGRAIYRKVLTRFLLLFACGLVYNQGWHSDWRKPFIGSVLGEIAFGYLFASLIVLHTRKLRSVVLWTGAIMAGVAAIQFLLPVPGYGAGVFTLQGSANAWIDRSLNPGQIMYHMTPDGTVHALGRGPLPPGAVPVADAVGILNWFSAAGITLMGVAAGLILKNPRVPPYRKVAIFGAAGVGCVTAALSMEPWYPIVKLLQTGTFYLLAGGISFLLLALFYLVIDVWRIRKGMFFFEALGVNALALYIGYQLIDVNYTSGVLAGGLAMHLANFGPLLVSTVTAGLVWTSAYLLYRKKVFLRI